MIDNPPGMVERHSFDLQQLADPSSIAGKLANGNFGVGIGAANAAQEYVRAFAKNQECVPAVAEFFVIDETRKFRVSVAEKLFERSKGERTFVGLIVGIEQVRG